MREIGRGDARLREDMRRIGDEAHTRIRQTLGDFRSRYGPSRDHRHAPNRMWIGSRRPDIDNAINPQPAQRGTKRIRMMQEPVVSLRPLSGLPENDGNAFSLP